MILALRTDKPEAELAVLDGAGTVVAEKHWHAHRELSAALLSVIDNILAESKTADSELAGIIVYQGPGSFTGLRIGVTVANTIAYSYGKPIVAARGEDWKEQGMRELQKNPKQQVEPHYGHDAHVTQPKK